MIHETLITASSSREATALLLCQLHLLANAQHVAETGQTLPASAGALVQLLAASEVPWEFACSLFQGILAFWLTV